MAPTGPDSAVTAVPPGSGHIRFETRFDGRFALTFDDGPHPLITPQLLYVLNRFQLKATFFVLGEYAVLSPHIIQAIDEAGHTLGCHGYHHTDFSKLSAAEIHAQLDASQQAIDSILGYRYPLKQVRPPYGNCDGAVEAVIAERGQDLVLWQFDAQESEAPPVSADHLLQQMVQLPATKNWSGVLLMHDLCPKSPVVLEAFIKQALWRGLTPMTTGQLIESLRS